MAQQLNNYNPDFSWDMHSKKINNNQLGKITREKNLIKDRFLLNPPKDVGKYLPTPDVKIKKL